MSKKHLSRSTLVTVLFLTFAVLASYIMSLSADFVIDDITGIVENREIANFSNVWSQPLSALRLFMLWVSYSIGGFDPATFRIFNILFHLGTVLGVYFLMRLLFPYRYAVITALLFAVHPILSEPVVWISSLPTVQYSFFLVASLLLYVKSLKSKDVRWYYVSLIAFIFSMLTSERAVALPINLVLLELSFFSVKKNWKKMVPYLGIVFLYGGLLALKIGTRVETYNMDPSYHFSYFNPLRQVLVAITSYLHLIFLPIELTVYHYDWTVGIAEYLVRGAAFIGLFTLIIFSYKRWRPVFFWLTFFLATLVPVLIPINIVWIVAERYVYLGTLGVIAAAAYPVASAAASNKTHRNLIYAFVGIVAVALSARTIVRTFDWQDEDTLLLRAAQTTPNSPRALNNVGGMYIRKNDSENAVYYFKRALAQPGSYPEIEYNLANTYFVTKDYENARIYYESAIKKNPKLWKSHLNLGRIYYMNGQLDKSEYHLNIALQNDPSDTGTAMVLKAIEKKKAKN